MSRLVINTIPESEQVINRTTRRIPIPVGTIQEIPETPSELRRYAEAMAFYAHNAKKELTVAENQNLLLSPNPALIEEKRATYEEWMEIANNAKLAADLSS